MTGAEVVGDLARVVLALLPIVAGVVVTLGLLGEVSR
jgi:hypothetical protein